MSRYGRFKIRAPAGVPPHIARRGGRKVGVLRRDVKLKDSKTEERRKQREKEALARATIAEAALAEKPAPISKIEIMVRAKCPMCGGPIEGSAEFYHPVRVSWRIKVDETPNHAPLDRGDLTLYKGWCRSSIIVETK